MLKPETSNFGDCALKYINTQKLSAAILMLFIKHKHKNNHRHIWCIALLKALKNNETVDKMSSFVKK